MNAPQQPTFQVSAYSDPIVVRVNGKANYLNCNEFRDFIERMLRDRHAHFVIDFEGCLGMDSTFLGILASTALELRKLSPPGILIICNLSERNHELINNLGLQNLLTIGEDLPKESKNQERRFDGLKNVEISDARSVLAAHESLVRADENNAGKFQDVIAFLRNQVEEEKGGDQPE